MYVITGASGHTGQIIVKRLLANHQKVRAVARHAEGLQPLVVEGAEPCVADLTDREALTRAFAGARAVYAMLPPAITSQDYRSDQDRISGTIAGALRAAAVKYAVTLSSVGADKPDKVGPVVGLYYLEQRLNNITGLNVLHLRAGYFMENTLAQAGIVRATGNSAGPLRPELKLPMIASRDIGIAVADSLLNLDFRLQQTRELHGQRDLSMNEASAVIGKAIGKPDLPYQQISDQQFRDALTRMGMSANVAALVGEMARAMNSGYMRALEPRSAHNTTPTSFETFVAEEFVPAYQHPAQAA
ncbi:MAG TPA: NAD(P)H-binding protein [Terriglobales bacterium]|jgi:uncharacterized protein YbjT (DUF2867 family)